MIDTKKTLQNLHKTFPDLNLDDLFAILECVVDYYPTTTLDTGTVFTTNPIEPKIY